MSSQTAFTEETRSADDQDQSMESFELVRARVQKPPDDRTEEEDSIELQENKEDISLLWFDKNLNSTMNDIQLTKELLGQINNYVLFFTKQDECLQYIKSVKDEKIILIISGLSTNDDNFLKEIHIFRQIDSVFVFCIEKGKYENVLLNPNYSKIVGIFTEQETLMRNIRQTIKLVEQQSAVFTLYNHTQKSTHNLTNESGSFVWHQLIKDALQKMPTDTTAGKREMLEKCYTYYRGNKKELQNIQQFERTYTPNDAIRWYTKDCFIYRLINKALRTEDIDVLHTFRYFITGLSACLQKDYQLLKQHQNTEILKLYRGVKQTNDEVQRLKESIGSLIFTNGFFSTTRNKVVAQMYAGIGCNDTKYESILFEIDINVQTHVNCIFADINNYSQFADEQEVLFDLATVFEITSMDYNSIDQYWICRMMSTNRGIEIAEEYLTYRKSEMAGTDADIVILFGHLLYDMGEHNKSQKYFENLLIDRSSDANVYMGIGHAQFIKSEYQEAIKNYKHAYDICNLSDFLLVASLLNYLGDVHRYNGEYDIASEYLSNALNILERNKSSHKSNKLRGYVLFNMSVLEGLVGDDAKALEHALEALDVINKLDSYPHLDLAHILSAIALAYRNIGEYNRSLQYQIQGLEITKKVYPDKHYAFGAAFNNIGKAYYKKCDYKTAIYYLEQSMEVYAHVWPSYHQRRAVLLNHLGKSYYRMKNYDQALNYYSQALNMLQKTVPANHGHIGYTIKNIGEVYLDLLDFDKAYNYFHQALTIYKENFGNDTDQRDIAKCYHLIGQVYLNQNDSEHALEHFHITLKMWQKKLVENHPDLALCTKNIAHAYLLRSENQKALEYLLKTLHIYESKLPVDDTKIIDIQNLIAITKEKINNNS